MFVVKQHFPLKQTGCCCIQLKKAVVGFCGSCNFIFFLEELKRFNVISTRWAHEPPLLVTVANRKDAANKAARCRHSAVTGDVCAPIAHNVAFPSRLALGVKGFQEKLLFKHL